jgi:hypothetical protein
MIRRRRPSPARKWLALGVAVGLTILVPIASTATSQDATAPTVTITSPEQGSTVVGSIRVVGKAKDRGGVSRVDVAIDDATPQVAKGAASWSYVVDTTALSDGSHTIVAKATDKKGNVGKATIPLVVANTPAPDVSPPTVSIQAPASGATLSGTATISGSANDDVGIAQMSLAVDGGGASAVTAGSAWSTTIETGSFSDGAHTVTVSATDGAGNVGTAVGSFVFENAPEPAPSPVPSPTVSPTPEPSPSPTPDPDPSPSPSSPPPPEPTFTCTGVSVLPGDDLRAKVDARPAGTTFCLRAGVHHVAAAILAKSFDSFIGESGAILDGGDTTDRGIFGYGGATGQHDVTITSVIFEDFTVEAIKAGWDWTIVDSEFRSSHIGVRVGTGTTLRDSSLHHNATYGIVAGPSSDVLIEGNELAFNGGTDDSGGSSGGSKIAGSTAGASHIVWRNNYVHHNLGPGIWSDGNVRYVTYEGNLLVENAGPGIFHEISWDATIRDNVARGNARNAAGKSCWWGSQIHVNTSQNVRILDNIVRTDTGANGICLVDANRPQVSPFPTDLANIEVRGNSIALSGTANTGLVGQAALNIAFDLNAYAVPDGAGKYWAWFDKYPLTWSEFRARAGESSGTVTAVVSGQQI